MPLPGDDERDIGAGRSELRKRRKQEVQSLLLVDAGEKQDHHAPVKLRRASPKPSTRWTGGEPVEFDSVRDDGGATGSANQGGFAAFRFACVVHPCGTMQNS